MVVILTLRISLGFSVSTRIDVAYLGNYLKMFKTSTLKTIKHYSEIEYLNKFLVEVCGENLALHR